MKGSDETSRLSPSISTVTACPKIGKAKTNKQTNIAILLNINISPFKLFYIFYYTTKRGEIFGNGRKFERKDRPQHERV